MWEKYFLHFYIPKKREGFIPTEKKKRIIVIIKKKKKIFYRSPLTEFSGISDTIGLIHWGGLRSLHFIYCPSLQLTENVSQHRHSGKNSLTADGQLHLVSIQQQQLKEKSTPNSSIQIQLTQNFVCVFSFKKRILKLINRSPPHSPKIMVFQKKRGMAVVRKQRQQNFICLE